MITSNLRLAEAPGNIFLPKRSSGLPKDSVVNVSQILTIDRAFLNEHLYTLSKRKMEQVEHGLRLALEL